MAIVAIIPARFGSTRLPGKPLLEIQGKPLIQHVYERVCRAQRPERVLVATDDARIARAVTDFGGEAVMTSAEHPTGTDRLAEAARRTGAGVIVNVQGDEPLIEPAAIDAAVVALLGDPEAAIATLSAPITDAAEMLDPAVVKVVCDVRGRALLFSRAPIPWVRGTGDRDAGRSARGAVAFGLARKHIGLYVYRREALEAFARLPPSPLEAAESLEQLRALHHGLPITVAEVDTWAGVAVDTPADLERVRRLMDGSAAVV